MDKSAKLGKLLKVKCLHAKKPSEKSRKVILTLEATQDENGSHLYCPELDIFVSAASCREMLVKFLPAMIDYFYSLKQLPEDYVGKVEKAHLALFDNQIIPTMLEIMSQEVREQSSTWSEIKKVWVMFISKVYECLNIFTPSKCERELLCLHPLSRLTKLSQR